MKKLLVLLIASLLIISCGENNSGTKTDNKKVEKVVEKYADLTRYVKSDITDDESKELLSILEQRVTTQAEIKKMIEEATVENKDESYDSIVEKRKKISDNVLPFLSETKVNSFKKYFENINFQIKKKLDELK